MSNPIPRSTYDLCGEVLRYTSNQTLRTTLADAEDGQHLYLIKSPAELQLTYQILMGVSVARNLGKKLVIVAAPHTKKSRSLSIFLKTNKSDVIWRKN